MLKVIQINPNTIDLKLINKAITHLRAGDIIIYPTDTSYGVGALYSNRLAVEKVYSLKNREENKKLSVIVPSINWVRDNLELSRLQEEILRKYLPGKFTFIINTKNSKDNLGIRIPKNNFTQILAKQLGEPFTATSANISGQQDCYSLKELNQGILRNIRLSNLNIMLFNAGKLKYGKRSTVIDITQLKPKILRQGSGKFIL